jgi:hypothetical protein
MKIILPIFAIAAISTIYVLWRDAGEQGSTTPLPSAITSAATPLTEDATARILPSQLDASGTDRTQAGILLNQAIDRLNTYQSVSALLRQRIGLFDADLIGTGLYQQQGQGGERRLRLELRIQLGDQAASQLQVCDGRVLWTHHEIGEDRRLNRLDLQRVRAAKRESVQAGPTSPVEELPTGGLPKLLDAIRASFQPLKVEAGYLDEVSTWAIEAEWRPEMIGALAPDTKQGANVDVPIDFSRLPQLPERVMLFLRNDDLFPLRIEFRRRAATDDQEQAGGAAFVPVATLDFSDIQLNQTIDVRQFAYRPPEDGLIVNDVTDQFLQARGLPLVR